MYGYQFVQWLLFFYLYCFLGWVWETSYVSVKNKKFVNRGFMHGPYLPIYGFGAIAVLFITIPVKQNIWLIFLFGMIGATVLEYFTGVAMERLFHVRYWDYSNQRWNLNGHICVKSSIAWGVFSIGLLRGLHRGVEALVLVLPYVVVETSTFLITVVMAVDFTQSFHEAMDLKELLANLTESNEEIRKIRKRLDVIIAVADSERKELVQKASESKHAFEVKLNQAVNSKKLVKYNKNLAMKREEKVHMLNSLSEHLTACMESIKTTFVKEAHEQEKLRAELEEFKESILRQKSRILSRSEKVYTRALGVLRRNPSAVSKRYEEALKEVKKLDEK